MYTIEITFYDHLWAKIQLAGSVIGYSVPIYKSIVPSLDLVSKITWAGHLETVNPAALPALDSIRK